MPEEDPCECPDQEDPCMEDPPDPDPFCCLNNYCSIEDSTASGGTFEFSGWYECAHCYMTAYAFIARPFPEPNDTAVWRDSYLGGTLVASDWFLGNNGLYPGQPPDPEWPPAFPGTLLGGNWNSVRSGEYWSPAGTFFSPIDNWCLVKLWNGSLAPDSLYWQTTQPDPPPPDPDESRQVLIINWRMTSVGGIIVFQARKFGPYANAAAANAASADLYNYGWSPGYVAQVIPPIEPPSDLTIAFDLAHPWNEHEEVAEDPPTFSQIFNLPSDWFSGGTEGVEIAIVCNPDIVRVIDPMCTSPWTEEDMPARVPIGWNPSGVEAFSWAYSPVTMSFGGGKPSFLPSSFSIAPGHPAAWVMVIDTAEDIGRTTITTSIGDKVVTTTTTGVNTMVLGGDVFSVGPGDRYLRVGAFSYGCATEIAFSPGIWNTYKSVDLYAPYAEINQAGPYSIWADPDFGMLSCVTASASFYSDGYAPSFRSRDTITFKGTWEINYETAQDYSKTYENYLELPGSTRVTTYKYGEVTLTREPCHNFVAATAVVQLDVPVGDPPTSGVAAVDMINNNVDCFGCTGQGYTSAPTVTFVGGGGFGAEGYAIVKDGQIIRVVITNPGSGYTFPPTVVFS